LQRVNDRIEVVSHNREMIEAALFSGVEIRLLRRLISRA
jgi:hypothetical protein